MAQTCPKCSFGNPDGARFCSNCGSALGVDRPLEGERRFATVVFADVARSTAIAEGLDPEDWTQIMNGAFAFMNAAVRKYDGTVSRLMGDAVLALFGAPVAHEDDAERAVLAGLELQEQGMRYARLVKAEHGVDFELRVGINSGTAVLAFVGDEIKTEYTAMGDVANVAARLQAAAEPGTVLIGAETHRLVHRLFDLRPRDPILAKGKQAPLDTYEVIGVKAQPGTARGIDGLTSPLVGRDRELGLLSERLTELRAGRGSVVAVIGEAGLGKSRLLAEMNHLRASMEDPRPTLRETRAISFGQTIPYYPWRQLGRQIVGASEMDSSPLVREKVKAWVDRLGLRTTDIPFYETMLAVESEDSRVALAAVSGEAIVSGVSAAIVNAFKTVLRADGAISPYIVVLDDLHWSDSATLELTAQVATLAAFEPLMLICVLRPDRKAASWQLIDRLEASLGDNFHRIDLEPLSVEGSDALLENLLRIENLPADIRQNMLERSEGNPFYLEELLRSLIDVGYVVRDGDRWCTSGDIAGFTIPQTLAGVLSARIDRLPEMTKRVAQTAAVIGRVFQHRVLETVCRDAPPSERVEHVEPHLATLSYEQLVREKARDPEREYIFKHALTCEAAYDLLLKSRRKQLHARAGRALEVLFADRSDEFAAMLAHHFSEADDLDRALSYSRSAAANARRLYALREEVEHRGRIVDILGRMPDAPPATVIDALVEWSWVRHRLAQYEGTLSALERAVSIAREVEDKPRLAVALSWIANHHIVTGFPSRSVPFMRESAVLAREIGDEQLLLLPLFFGTWSLVDRDPRAAVDQLQEIIELARQYDDIDVEGHAIGYRAIAFARTGDFASARAEIRNALAILPRTAGPVKRADIHIAIGMAYHDMGQLDEALEHAREGARLAENANGLECACAGYFGVGRVELDRNNPDGALAEFNQSLRFSDLSGFEGFLTAIRGSAAVAEFELGNKTAVDRLRSARDNALSLNDDYAAAVLSQRLAATYLRLNRFDDARPALDMAMRYYREAGMRPYIANALEVEAGLLAATGQAADAERARSEAMSLRLMMPAPSQPPSANPLATP